MDEVAEVSLSGGSTVPATMGRWNVPGTWSSAFQRLQKLTITGMRSIFACGCHLRFLTATVSRLADASGLATRPWHPGLIDGRLSPYAGVQSTICELDTPCLVWPADCDISTVSLQKRAVDSEVSSIRQLAYRDFTFLASWKQLLGPTSAISFDTQVSEKQTSVSTILGQSRSLRTAGAGSQTKGENR